MADSQSAIKPCRCHLYRGAVTDSGKGADKKPSGVLVLSDEIYEHILFDDRAFVSFLKACPELRNRVLRLMWL